MSAGGVSTDGVEVAQADDLVGYTSVDYIVEDLFIDLLRVAVGREGYLDRSFLGDGQDLGLAVDGARRGEDDPLGTVALHSLEEDDQ